MTSSKFLPVKRIPVTAIVKPIWQAKPPSIAVAGNVTGEAKRSFQVETAVPSRLLDAHPLDGGSVKVNAQLGMESRSHSLEVSVKGSDEGDVSDTVRVKLVLADNTATSIEFDVPVYRFSSPLADEP
jgi:hypothetical protein